MCRLPSAQSVSDTLRVLPSRLASTRARSALASVVLRRGSRSCEWVNRMLAGCIALLSITLVR